MVTQMALVLGGSQNKMNKIVICGISEQRWQGGVTVVSIQVVHM